MKPNPLVFADSDGELSVQLYREGKKLYDLYFTHTDATWGATSETHITLRFGLTKARAAAKAYWDLYKIQKGRM